MVRIDYAELPNRSIIAMDIKSFFASVEAVKLGLHPLHAYVIVLSGKERAGGLVLAASPLVKSEFGIKTGSRKFEIPNSSKLIIVEPRMSLYLKVNGMIIDILRKYVANEDLLVYSIDEMLLDVTKSHRLFGDTRTIAKKIQMEIWNSLRLVSTVAIGPNPLMAKVCMDIEAKKVESCMAEWTYDDVPTKLQKIHPMTDMWGIGNKTARKLEFLGIRSIEELANADVNMLKRVFGVIGEQIFYHAHGVDYTILSQRYIPKSKSYGNSQVLMRDYTKQREIEIVIREMADQVAARLRRHAVEAGVLRLNIGFSQEILERGFARQRMMEYNNSTSRLTEVALAIFRDYYRGEPVRTIAISCGKIKEKGGLQLSLFEDPLRTIQNERLDHTIDKVRERYGFTSLIHASSMLPGGTAVKRSTFVGGHQG